MSWKTTFSGYEFTYKLYPLYYANVDNSYNKTEII